MIALFLSVALAQDPAQWIQELVSGDKEQRARAESYLKENGHRMRTELRKAWEEAKDDDAKTRLGWILDYVGRSFVRGKGNPVVAMALNEDERLLVIARKDALEVWDVETGTQKVLHAREVAGPIAVRADGARIAIVHAGPLDPRAPRDYSLQMVDASSGTVCWEERRYRRDYALGFSPDGKTLAVSGAGLVRLLDAEDGHELREFEATDGPARQDGHGTGFSFDGASSRFAYGTIRADWACEVVVFDLASDKEVGRFGGPRGLLPLVRFGKDGKGLLSVDYTHPSVTQRTARTWEAGRKDPVEATPAPAIDGVTPDLETLVGLTESGEVAITDMESGKTRAKLETGTRRDSNNPEGGFWWEGGFFVLGPSGRHAAVALGASGDVGLLRLEDGTWR